jgi:hypothetical protein
MAWFARRRVSGLSRLIAAALLLAACSQELEWRETRLAHAAALLPGRAQTVARAVLFEGQMLEVTMTSTGVGAAMFAIGEVQLPPQVAGNAAAQERVIAYFRDALVRNIGGTVSASEPATPVLPPGSSQRFVKGQFVQAQGRTADGRSAALAARFFIVDDRLFQLVALGSDGGVGSQALDTLFTSFRPLP